MGFLDKLFSRRRHVRGTPTEDDTDPFSHTRLIPRPEAGGGREADPWGEQGGRDPFEADLPPANADAPTELRLPDTEMPPRRIETWSAPEPPRQPARADYGRRPAPREAPAGPSGDETVLGDTIGVGRTGRVLGVLVATEGPLEGFVARVVEGKNVLGRDGHPDPIPKQEETRGISRQHATLEAEAGGFVIEPASDRNAVFVNEQLVDQRTLLNHGDRIRLGMKQPLTLVLLVVP